jgi:DNA phosphorothioation-dependent restriction protein DptG
VHDENEKQLIILTTLCEDFREKLERFERLLDEFHIRCSAQHGQIQRDLGRLDGRTAGISAVISAIMAAVMAWIFRS